MKSVQSYGTRWNSPSISLLEKVKEPIQVGAVMDCGFTSDRYENLQWEEGERRIKKIRTLLKV